MSSALRRTSIVLTVLVAITQLATAQTTVTKPPFRDMESFVAYIHSHIRAPFDRDSVRLPAGAAAQILKNALRPKRWRLRPQVRLPIERMIHSRSGYTHAPRAVPFHSRAALDVRRWGLCDTATQQAQRSCRHARAGCDNAGESNLLGSLRGWLGIDLPGDSVT